LLSQPLIPLFSTHVLFWEPSARTVYITDALHRGKRHPQLP
jgi:hypothetical protein